MADCQFTIDRAVQPNGDIVFSTNPDFNTCEVLVSVGGTPAGPNVGSNVGDYHIIGLGHSSVTVQALNADPQTQVTFKVQCADCGPTEKSYPSVMPPPPDNPVLHVLQIIALILISPFVLLARAIWDWLQALWDALKKLAGQIGI